MNFGDKIWEASVGFSISAAGSEICLKTHIRGSDARLGIERDPPAIARNNPNNLKIKNDLVVKKGYWASRSCTQLVLQSFKVDNATELQGIAIVFLASLNWNKKSRPALVKAFAPSRVHFIPASSIAVKIIVKNVNGKIKLNSQQDGGGLYFVRLKLGQETGQEMVEGNEMGQDIEGTYDGESWNFSDRAKAHLALTKSAIRKPVNKKVGAIKAQPYQDAKMYSFLQKGLNVRMLDGVHSSATEAEEDNSVKETVLVWMVGLNWLKARRMGATIHIYLPGRGDPFYQEMRKVLEVKQGVNWIHEMLVGRSGRQITDQLPKMPKDAWSGDYYAKGGLKSVRAHVPEKKKGKAIPFIAHGRIAKERSAMVDYSRGNRDLPCLGIDEE
ncbi:hypothetical protein C8J56DRAFT_1081468 [Mycena floridula]|nr:hypothetical protein C8J56DRAFT_1081468 [Mycena floridula]